jgi:hypothetical protein
VNGCKKEGMEEGRNGGRKEWRKEGRKISSDLLLQIQMMSTKLPFNEGMQKFCGYA